MIQENIYKKCVAFEPGCRYEIKSELIDSNSSYLRPLVNTPFVFKGEHPCVSCHLKVIKDSDSLASYRWIKEYDKKEFYSWDHEEYADVIVFAHQCVEVLGEDTKQMIMHRIKGSLYALNDAIINNKDQNTLKDISDKLLEKVKELEKLVYNKEIKSNK